MGKYMTIGDVPIDYFTNKSGKNRHNMPTFGDHLTAAGILRPNLVKPLVRKKKNKQVRKSKPDITKLLTKCGFTHTCITFTDTTREHLQLRRIVYPNQIKRDYPDAVSYYYLNPADNYESDEFNF